MSGLLVEVLPDLVAVHRRQEGVHLLLCEDLLGFIAGLGHRGPGRSHGLPPRPSGTGGAMAWMRSTMVSDSSCPYSEYSRTRPSCFSFRYNFRMSMRATQDTILSPR